MPIIVAVGALLGIAGIGYVIHEVREITEDTGEILNTGSFPIIAIGGLLFAFGALIRTIKG